jgi:hypothetical protein
MTAPSCIYFILTGDNIGFSTISMHDTTVILLKVHFYWYNPATTLQTPKPNLPSYSQTLCQKQNVPVQILNFQNIIVSKVIE